MRAASWWRSREGAEDGLPDAPSAVHAGRLQTEALRVERHRKTLAGLWQRGSGYHRRRRAEPKMHRVKLLGQRLISRDFHRIAMLSG